MLREQTLQSEASSLANDLSKLFHQVLHSFTLTIRRSQSSKTLGFWASSVKVERDTEYLLCFYCGSIYLMGRMIESDLLTYTKGVAGHSDPSDRRVEDRHSAGSAREWYAGMRVGCEPEQRTREQRPNLMNSL